MGLLTPRGEDDEEKREGEIVIAGLDDLDAGDRDEITFELDEWSDHDRAVLRDRLETLGARFARFRTRMPSATVKIPPVLRPQTGGEATVAADGSTVGDMLESLVGAHPDTRTQLFSEDGALNRYVNVYLNDEDVRVLDGLETAIDDGDTVVILPAMAGGS